MKFKREDIIRETALIQRGLTRITKSPFNIINYFILGVGIFIIITVARDDFFGQKGLIALAGLTVCNFIFIFLYSFAYFSRVISEEKESRTMLLLRLTPVRSTNIFFGKLLPPFINLMQILIFQIPIVVFVITLGGANLEQILSIYLLLILTACLLAVTGVWVSSANPENWLAYFNFIFMLFLVALAYGGVQMMRYSSYMKDFARYIKVENPFTKAAYILFNPADPRAGISQTLLIYSALAVLGLFLAYRSFLKNLDVEEYAVRDIEKEKNNTARSINFGQLPLLQKEFYFGCGGKKGQILVFILFVIMAAAFFFNENGTYSSYEVPSIVTKIALMQIFVIALYFLYIIGNSFRRELKENTWEDLLISPLTAKDIIYQKVLGTFKFIFPFIILALLMLLLNFKYLNRDCKYIIDEFPAIWITPAAYCAIVCSCIYFQLFEKFPAFLFGIFAGSTIGILMIIVTESKGEQTTAIIVINILLAVSALFFYRLAITTIDKQINLKNKD